MGLGYPSSPGNVVAAPLPLVLLLSSLLSASPLLSSSSPLFFNLLEDESLELSDGLLSVRADVFNHSRLLTYLCCLLLVPSALHSIASLSILARIMTVDL